MYYRYKVTKKKKGRFKTFLIIIVVVVLSYLAFTHRNYLAFWKYTSNKMLAKIGKVEHIADPGLQKRGLLELADILEKYREDNQVDPDAFFMSGKVHFLLGKTYLDGNFSDLVIYEKYHHITEACREELIKSIKYIKKGQTLLQGKKIPFEYAMILAMANFYTDPLSIDSILAILNKADAVNIIKDREDVRFVSIIYILNGKYDDGLKMLLGKGDAVKSVEGMLFLAAAEVMAKQYTSAIQHYKNVLGSSANSTSIKVAHVNMGKIYYNQSLYRESLEHFTSAGEIDKQDFNLKIWIGKNYFAMGLKDRAKAIWSEVLAVDKTNSEVKALLGIM